MRAFIFANGVFQIPSSGLMVSPDDLVIAADGGSQHCQELGLTPTVLIGDLDSADPDLTARWQAAGLEVIQHPERKDQTDLELALMLAQERGAQEILVYGAVGGRLDMTFSNLTLLAHPGLHTPTRLICGKEEIQLMAPGDSLVLDGQPGEALSLIPLQPGQSVVSARGVGYPLEADSLTFGTTRGISNYFVGSQAVIELKEGLLAVVHTRGAFPGEEGVQ